MAKELIRISAPYSLAALVSAGLLNVDYLVIGHRLGTVAVGIYLIAFNVSSWPTTLGRPSREGRVDPQFLPAAPERG